MPIPRVPWSGCVQPAAIPQIGDFFSREREKKRVLSVFRTARMIVFAKWRRVHHCSRTVIFSKARMIVWREIAISDFGSGIFRLSGRPGSEEIVSNLLGSEGRFS